LCFAGVWLVFFEETQTRQFFMKQRIKIALLLGLSGLMAHPELLACATCYGESDSNMAAGMSWGILSLMVVAYSVLLGIVSFFGYLMYRSHRMASLMDQETIHPSDSVHPKFNHR
jgi:hypothetical protein